jgi:glycosyltransferase involved in cell wall biosynthesis
LICISEWQKKYIIEYSSIPKDKMFVSRNAIEVKRFTSIHTQRIPHRFIYTSSVDRGLIHFINLIPNLRNIYADATFEIFCNTKMLTEEMVQKMKLTYNNETSCFVSEMDYVNVHSRVSQDQLAIELSKSDVWLYPTDFTETYCISAVEAMAAGCLVATVDLAALSEIVGNRGIVSTSIETLFDELITVLNDPIRKQEMVERGQEWAWKQDMFSLAREWETHLFTI